MDEQKLTDREMLELAAKAAGYGVQWDADESCFWGYYPDEIRDVDCPWNPLTDDGDALRLAVKLKLNVDLAYEEECVVRVFNEAHFFKESTAQDPYVATRRAIVRAAAAIGQSMS